MGFGLKALSPINNGDLIIKMKTSMGMISDSISETMGVAAIDEAEEDLHSKLMQNTRKVADHLSNGIPQYSNKLNNHLILTQKLLMVNRKESDYSAAQNYIKHYIAALPKQDLSQIIYWD